MTNLKLIAMVDGAPMPIVEQGFVPGQRIFYATLTGDGNRFRLMPTVVEFDLDAEYDGVTLRDLLKWDQRSRQEDGQRNRTFGGSPTPVQRAAISAHWSAELRAKVAAAKQKEREQVVSDYDEDRP